MRKETLQISGIRRKALLTSSNQGGGLLKHLESGRISLKISGNQRGNP
jgi:hypothetical protein